MGCRMTLWVVVSTRAELVVLVGTVVDCSVTVTVSSGAELVVFAG